MRFRHLGHVKPWRGPRRASVWGCFGSIFRCGEYSACGLAMAPVRPYRKPQRALRLSVRTAAFHVAETGSTPVGRTNTFICHLFFSFFRLNCPTHSQGWTFYVLHRFSNRSCPCRFGPSSGASLSPCRRSLVQPALTRRSTSTGGRSHRCLRRSLLPPFAASLRCSVAIQRRCTIDASHSQTHRPQTAYRKT
jgi:hypothetical protein